VGGTGLIRTIVPQRCRRWPWRAGLGDLAEEHLRIGRKCGVNAHLNVPCLVAEA
jgi:hypothetical protein